MHTHICTHTTERKPVGRWLERINFQYCFVNEIIYLRLKTIDATNNHAQLEAKHHDFC